MVIRAACLVGAGAVLMGALDYWAAPTYPVHQSGAVLITGASTGIGLHAAKGLAEMGYRVYAGVRSQADVEKIKRENPSLEPVIIDVTIEETVTRTVQQIKEELKIQGLKFVGLVNCAGVSRRLPLELEDMDIVKQLYEVNVFGVTRVTQAFLELLRDSQGRIVNIGSVAALLPHKGSSTYSGSKAALEMITDSLRLELAPWKISVSVVQPGYVQTALAEKQTGDNAPWRKEAHDKAPGPEVTTDAIKHAMTSTKPKTRYVVANVKGTPAWVLAFLGWLGEDAAAKAKVDEAPIPNPETLEESTEVEEAPLPVPEILHGPTRRLWQHIKSLGLLQTSGTVTKHSVFNPVILVAGLISTVIALSAVIAFTTTPSDKRDGKRPVARCPAPAAGAAVLAEGRRLSAVHARAGVRTCARPSDIGSRHPCSSVSVPAASATSLPSPRKPTHVGGEEGGMFNWSPRSADEDEDTLCPCLVVPDGMEFVFAVREVLTVLRQELSFSVVDLEGSPLSHIIVNESGLGPQCGIFLQMLDQEPLASIRTDMLHGWPTSLPQICLASGEVFCTMERRGQEYVLRDNNNEMLLKLEGNFKEKAVKVISGSGQLVAVSERLDGGEHYQVRVAPRTDAGLVLCSLLAVDKIEGGGRAS
ncbi:unnamed protein product [Durusdinium trenchii]|uniref:Ketoreductase domain-containing protein n=1 Tax=Durusdinium trenchii TaxID=1381693 RepID=A0ABP0NQH2_9DINO